MSLLLKTRTGISQNDELKQSTIPTGKIPIPLGVGLATGAFEATSALCIWFYFMPVAFLH